MPSTADDETGSIPEALRLANERLLVRRSAAGAATEMERRRSGPERYGSTAGPQPLGTAMAEVMAAATASRDRCLAALEAERAESPAERQARRERQVAREEAQARRHRRDQLERSGIDEVLTDEDVDVLVADELEPTLALRRVREWFLGGVPIIGLFGPPDAGKSIAAGWAIARHAGTARYIEAVDLAMEFRADYGKPSDGFAAYLRAELLVIDELGTEDDAARARATLRYVLNRRRKGRRRTILIGNMDRAELTEVYGSSLMSRLTQKAELYRVPATGMRSRGG